MSELKKNKKQISKLSSEVDNLKDKLFYFIKNLDESSLGASNFYINLLGYLQDITQSIEYVSKVSLKHINNNHSKLTLNQIRDLLDIQKVISEMFESIASAFASKSFGDIKSILKDKSKMISLLEDKIEAQISRTRTSEEKSPKNAFFGLFSSDVLVLEICASILSSKRLIILLLSFKIDLISPNDLLANADAILSNISEITF